MILGSHTLSVIEETVKKLHGLGLNLRILFLKIEKFWNSENLDLFVPLNDSWGREKILKKVVLHT